MVRQMLLVVLLVTLDFGHVTAATRKKILIVTPPEDVAVFPGERIQLKCETTGQPLPTVIWYKNTNRVTFVADEVVQMPDDSLVIPKASLDRDVGEYQCIATNSYETEFSRKVKVNVKHLETKFRADPADVNTTVMSFALIKCMPPGAYPPLIISWYKDGSPVKKRDDIVIYVDTTGDSVLRIGNVLYSDRGLYACLAENELGSRESKSGSLNVFIPPPRLHDSSPLVRAFAGDTVSLYCESMFEPQPKREWEKIIGVPPDKDRIQITPTGEYMIRNAVLRDSGSYKCTASNDAGFVEKAMNLTVYSKPAFVRQPTDIKVPGGSNVTLECSITGGWEPQVWWRKSDRHRTLYKHGVFRTDSDRILLLENNDLKILAARIDDSGEFECVVNDNYDVTLSAKATLTVTDDVAVPLPSMSLYPLNQTVNAGDDVSLFCDVSSNMESPSVRWESAADVSLIKPGVLGFQFKQDKQVYQLIMSAVSRKDAGVYRCIATNAAGTTMQNAIVNVEAGPQAPDPVKNLKVTALNGTSVELSWAPPDAPSLTQIDAYIITIDDVLRSLQQKTVSTLTSLTISNLQPGASYKFTVVAKNKYGTSVPVVSQVVQTQTSTDVTALPPDSTTKPVKDRLLDVILFPNVDGVSASSANISWNAVAPSRVNGFIVYYQKDGDSIFSEQVITKSDAQSYVLQGLMANTIYSVKMRAYNREYHGPMSKVITLKTVRRMPLGSPVNVQLLRRSDSSLNIRWEDPDDLYLFPEVIGFEVAWQAVQSNASFFVMTVPKDRHSVTLHDLETYTGYQIYLSAKTSTETGQRIGIPNVVIANLPLPVPETTLLPLKPSSAKNGSVLADILKVVKEPWFIATCGVLLWIILLVVVIYICCKRAKKRRMSRSDPFLKHRLLNDSRRSDYPNTSLNRSRIAVSDNSFTWNDADAHEQPSLGRGTMKSCCKSQGSSGDDDFPNKADVKPLMPFRQENIEMKTKTSNLDLARSKDTNLRMALENGYRDPLLNNKRQFVDVPIPGNDRVYDSGTDDSRSRQKRKESLEQPGSAPNSGSMPRKDDSSKTDSAERRHEIVRTAAAKKSFPDAELVNVMENNSQASWKREQNNDSPRANKPPGEETLRRRREGKNAYKPVPKLESVRLTEGLLPPSKPLSVVEESQAGSPKMSPSASMFSENQDGRDSRLSHGGSSTSLNKEEKSGQISARRLSNASSMMSSELYQSEMDHAYSDHVSERRRRKEKPVPPPIDLEGLTSDILLQWADSVTNSSPSSSGSSSPSRLSAISSDGSFYTDEDFAQAVAAVAECRGFNMDYDYSLPGMPGAPGHLPFSSRNEKMNRIDEMLAKSKSRNSPASTQSKLPQPTGAPSSYPYVPQLSFTNYLPGANKSGLSLHSSPAGLVKPRQLRSGNGLENSARYGTGLQDIDSVLGKPSPLTVSNLMHHDSSLERGKKPLTVSNVRQLETSLDRDKRHHKPVDKIPSHLIDRGGPSAGRREKDASKMSPRDDRYVEIVARPPEPPLSVTSALERNESMNSRDSATSSNKHDSEVENPTGRKSKRRNERTSSTSTGSTVRTSPDVDEQEQNATEC